MAGVVWQRDLEVVAVRVLGIVPARGGSKRAPRKNVRLLGGKSLVARAVEACLGARSLTKTVVSSDDSEALRIAASYPNITALPRPAELATDASPALDYVKHALNALESAGDAPYEAIAIVQPSSPFTQSADIDACVALLIATSEADSAVSVSELDQVVHPIKLKRLDGTALIPFLEDERGRMANHELPKLYSRNGAVYVSRRSTIDAGSVIGETSHGYVMPRERSVDINDEFDWRLAEFILSSGAQ
jgi:CMP-N,N'-diacetyllegionaminic acid synthase